MTVITMPDGKAVDFGDMPPAQIKEIIRQKYPDRYGAPEAATTAPVEPQRGGWMDTLMGLGSLMNPVAAAGQAASGNPAMNAAGQGLTFGLSDEIGGLGGGAIEAAKGGSFSEGYGKTVDTARSELNKYREANPVGAGVMEGAGALLTLPATAGLNVFRAPQAVRAGAPLATKAANAATRAAASTGNAAITGAAYGGAYGAGTAEGGPGARLEGLLGGAGTGAALGVGGNALLGAGKWIAQTAYGRPLQALRKITGPRREAQRQVVEAIRDDAASAGQTPQQAMQGVAAGQRQGAPMVPLDIGETTRGLADTASIVSPQGRNILNDTLGQRFETQNERIIDTITRNAPGVNAPNTRLMLEDAARNVNHAAYDRAYRQGANGIWNQQLEGLTVSPDIQAAIRDATRIGANEAARRGHRPPRNPFTQAADGSINPQPNVSPTLEFWDHVKRSLDGQIGIQRRAGNNEYAAQLTGLKNDLVRILDQSAPAYQQARQGAAAFFGADNALDAGSAFVKRPVDNAAARQAIDRMSPAERQLFGEGFATQLIDDIRNVSDRHNVINRVFRSPAARERFEIALGRDATDAMEATVRLEDIMDMGRVAVTGNSATARRQLAAQAALGWGTGAAISGDPLDPKNLAFMLLTLGGGRVVSRADQQMGRHIAEMLTSNNPQVVRDALQRIGRNPRMVENMRAGHGILTRALTPAVVGGGVNPKEQE